MSLLADVERFAFPRFPGTEGDRRAVEMIASSLAAAGLDVVREPFVASRAALPRLRLLLHGITASGVIFFATIARREVPGAWLAGLGVFLLVVASSRWPRSIERAFDVGPPVTSENVAGRWGATRPGHGEPDAAGDVATHVVFLAHHDTKSTRFPTLYPAVIILATLLWLGVATGIALLASVGVADFPRALAALGWGLAGALVVVAWNPAANESPGAMDNASGLAVLLALAERLPRDPALARARLTLLATGAEEVGLVGAMRWIQAHGAELDRRRTFFVNVDSVGVGKTLLAVDLRGRAPGGRPMQQVVRDAARKEGVPLRVLPFVPGAGVDTMPIGARGFATATILGDVVGAPAQRIHSARDTAESLREAALDAALRVCAQVAREVTAGGVGAVGSGGTGGNGGVASRTLGGSRRSGE